MTYLTRASGGAFSEFSHEFQTVCDAGEDTIYIDGEEAINEEIVDGTHKANLNPKAIEVGNIFNLGTRFLTHRFNIS